MTCCWVPIRALLVLLLVSCGTHRVRSKAFFFDNDARDCVCVPYYMCHSSEHGEVMVLRESPMDVRLDSRMTMAQCPHSNNEALYCCTSHNMNLGAPKPLHPLRSLRQIPVSANQMVHLFTRANQTRGGLVSSQARPVLQTTERGQSFTSTSRPVARQEQVEINTPGFGQQGSVSLISVPDNAPSAGFPEIPFENPSSEDQQQPVQNQTRPGASQQSTMPNIRPLNSPQFTNGVQRCGQLDGLDVRLQGGSKGRVPWVVSLWKQPSDGSGRWQIFCGGSLILERVVLTAAHCLTNFEPQYETLVIRSSDGTQQIPVSRTVSHPNFNAGNLHNDIALLYLDRAISLGREFDTATACLSLPDVNSDESRSCIATGFDDQQTVQSVEVPIVPRDACQQLLRGTRLGAYFRLDISFMCAGGQFGRDTCQGDGGSPLFCLVGSGDQAAVTQLGIVSWGIGCGTRDVPGVYASTSFASNWVDSQIRAAGLDPSGYRAARNTVAGRVANNRRF